MIYTTRMAFHNGAWHLVLVSLPSGTVVMDSPAYDEPLPGRLVIRKLTYEEMTSPLRESGMVSTYAYPCAPPGREWATS